MERRKFNPKLKVDSWDMDGFNILTIHPTNMTGKHVIFFHGGAYVLEAISFHRKLMEKLAIAYGLTVSFIDYPKAPEYTYLTTVDVVNKAYLEIVSRYPKDDFYLMGDSAGGGLALVLLQILRDKGITPFPKKTVLISPWLDLSMSNPDIPEYESLESLLPVKGLIYTGKMYAGGEDLRNPLLSPIYGDLSDLGKILLIFGTNEILYPDCMALVEKLSRSQGSTIEIILGENMMHNWIIFPFPESRDGIIRIAQFILGE
jgi:acetyl esterase/lipase